MNRQWNAFLAGAAALLLATGCSSSKFDTGYYEPYATGDTANTASSAQGFAASKDYVSESESVYDEAALQGDVDYEDVPDSAEVPQRKIVRHANLSLETMAFDEAVAGIQEMVTHSGGYVEQQSVDGKSINHTGYYERYASINARIPAEKLDDVLAQVGDLCNVTSKSESVDDISESYYDSQARLKTLQMQEERLLEILSKAAKLEEVISLERALSDTRYEIEAITAALKRMDSQVTYSYLNLELREVVEYQEKVAKPATFSDRFSQSLARSGDNFVYTIQNIILGTVEILPVLLLWLVVTACIFLLIRMVFRCIRKSLAKKRALKSEPDGKPAVSDKPNA